jgi:hypothetical protein
MRLEIKQEYKDFFIGGGSLKKVKLSELSESNYKRYYDLGYQSFFNVYTDEEVMIKNSISDDEKTFKIKVNSVLEEGGIYMKKLKLD